MEEAVERGAERDPPAPFSFVLVSFSRRVLVSLLVSSFDCF